jgi:hypothetical protein
MPGPPDPLADGGFLAHPVLAMEHCVSNGGGSCPRCRGSLGLASQKVGGVWYCSAACAEGRRNASSERPRVPESWLYARPRRFFGSRRPKELNSTRAGR